MGVVMPAQRVLVLLVLTALFTMHGIQSMGTGQPAGHATMGTVPQAMAAALDGDTLMGSAIGVTRLQPVAEPRPSLALTRNVMPGTAPGHGVAGHFWSLCLAVLLAGLTLVGALAAVRRVAAAGLPETVGWPRQLLARVGPLRPPDLASLCLLRI